MSLVPIVFLVLVTVVKRIKLKTSISLPLAALMLYLIRLAYFKHDSNYVNAAAVFGVLDALTPLSIIAGAICLFETMEQTQVRFAIRECFIACPVPLSLPIISADHLMVHGSDSRMKRGPRGQGWRALGELAFQPCGSCAWPLAFTPTSS